MQRWQEILFLTKYLNLFQHFAACQAPTWPTIELSCCISVITLACFHRFDIKITGTQCSLSQFEKRVSVSLRK